MKSAAGREKNAESSAAENSVEVVFSSTAPEQEDSNAAETNAKAEEPLVGVWIPYMAPRCDGEDRRSVQGEFCAKLAAAKSVGHKCGVRACAAVCGQPVSLGVRVVVAPFDRYAGERPRLRPMEYMVNAAHEQNMQFHAWINPLRIASTTIPPELDENGFYMQNYVNHPGIFYGVQ